MACAAARALPADLVLTLASASLFVLAAAIAGLAWQQRSRQHPGLSYWDVAGALTLIGICASALIEPEQMARVMIGTSQRPRVLVPRCHHETSWFDAPE